MRALVLSALLLAGLISQATAQLAVGPITINNNVNGLPIAVSASAWVTVSSSNNDMMVDARIFADLVDLQKKFSEVVDTFKLPADNCAGRGDRNPNPVVQLKRSSLWPRGNQLVVFIRGQVDLWSCIALPSKSEIQWQTKKIGAFKMKVPVLHTWPNLRKNKNGGQPFDANLPFLLVKKDNATVALEVTKPDIVLKGRNVSVTNAIMKIANVDIKQKAYGALLSAIDPAKLKAVLPQELQKLNMYVVSARFRDEGGHAMAEINLVAKVPGNSIPQLLEQIAAAPVNHNEMVDTILYSQR
jgi:hypothetical protein